MSHLGRPTAQEPEFSLRHIVSTLETILGVQVLFSSDCIGEEAQATADNLEPGQVLLLENLRYHSEETKGDLGFAEALSKLGDFYINDAFGTAHRAHASTTIIAQFFPESKCFGSLLAQEIDRPFVPCPIVLLKFAKEASSNFIVCFIYEWFVSENLIH